MLGSFFDKVGTSTPVRDIRDGVKGANPAVPTSERATLDDSNHGCRRWGARGDTLYGVGETFEELDPGLYRCGVTHLGPCFFKQRIETDQLLELPDDAGASIISEFQRFWEIGNKFHARGFLHKRGFLLWGPPGSGKTSTLQLLIKRLIEDIKGVVLLLECPSDAASCLQLARKIEPHRPMIAIMEDLDALVRKHGESEYLALLDGEAQVDNIVFLGTTNYPELLDRRFVDRPSRFDTIRYIGMPSAEARRLYLSTKEPSLQGDELEMWIKVSEGFSVAHLKEMIIAVKCFDQPIENVVERLEEMSARRPTSDRAPDRVGTGFINGAGHPAGRALG